jgi:hypothetical protein
MEQTKEGGEMIPSIEELNTREIPNPLLDLAKDRWEEDDILGVLCLMSNESSMGFVADNWYVLKKHGKYEEALLHAYITIRTNYSNWSMDILKFLFAQTDIEKLRKLGDPIPDKDTFTLYRGVNGIGRQRRVNSFSWTESPTTAAWFAKRFDRPDPAVFTLTVPNESIMAFIMERNEEEYLVKLPLPTKPKRLKELPEAIIRRHNGLSLI